MWQHASPLSLGMENASNATRNLPFSRSYWVIPGQLLAGAYPGSSGPAEGRTKIAGLIEAGVTRVVSLMYESERNHAGQAFVDYTTAVRALAVERGRAIECFRHPIVDGSVPTGAVMKQLLDRIDEELSAKGTVYVHCWGGRGRTGTVVCCWLIRHRLVVPGKAVDHLQTLVRHNAAAFHPTPENEKQKDFVRNWLAGA